MCSRNPTFDCTIKFSVVRPHTLKVTVTIMLGQLLPKQYRVTRLIDNLYRSGQLGILLNTARHANNQTNIASRGVVGSAAASSLCARLSDRVTLWGPGTNFLCGPVPSV